MSIQVTDVKDQAIRCYELDYNASPGQTQTATVAAGSTVAIKGMWFNDLLRN